MTPFAAQAKYDPTSALAKLTTTITQHEGCLRDAASSLGISRRTLYHLLEQHPGWRQEVDATLQQLRKLGFSLKGWHR